ncbi:2,3-diaminopropionate biosynthesis protein SbnA [Paenibacillus kobensis]|uniref:2,3-diaminopropionate biosynthesis protein SbnA n=1 Tax=Paenibacillus kobensis TaxID=59841 RepID=UPI000FD7AACE|nr:2,3-diaminopropionate biosynthesis protein SbnA [Paenibacillus kobensis]
MASSNRFQLETETGVLRLIGGTPLVPLRRLYPDARVNIYAKLEMYNPGGSAKDRPALRMMKEAIATGQVGPNTTIVESSSGNMAISLSMICGVLGLRFICVVDPRTAETNLRIIRSYGAQIDFVSEPDPATGEFLPARIARVNQLVNQIGDAYWPNQYGNEFNAAAHRDTTMPEIAEAIGEIDMLLVGVSSCGSIRGCADYVHGQGWRTSVIGVDAAGSVIFGGPGSRRLPGLGAGIVPPLFKTGLADSHETVSDLDCAIGCRRLLRRESIMVGGSAGGVIMALERRLDQLPDGANVVVILADRGDRYLDTVYSDDWVRNCFGEEAAVRLAAEL